MRELSSASFLPSLSRVGHHSKDFFWPAMDRVHQLMICKTTPATGVLVPMLVLTRILRTVHGGIVQARAGAEAAVRLVIEAAEVDEGTAVVRAVVLTVVSGVDVVEAGAEIAVGVEVAATVPVAAAIAVLCSVTIPAQHAARRHALRSVLQLIQPYHPAQQIFRDGVIMLTSSHRSISFVMPVGRL